MCQKHLALTVKNGGKILLHYFCGLFPLKTVPEEAVHTGSRTLCPKIERHPDGLRPIQPFPSPVPRAHCVEQQ
jgi:hypothetical protein